MRVLLTSEMALSPNMLQKSRAMMYTAKRIENTPTYFTLETKKDTRHRLCNNDAAITLTSAESRLTGASTVGLKCECVSSVYSLFHVALTVLFRAKTRVGKGYTVGVCKNSKITNRMT